MVLQTVVLETVLQHHFHNNRVGVGGSEQAQRQAHRTRDVLSDVVCGDIKSDSTE